MTLRAAILAVSVCGLGVIGAGCNPCGGPCNDTEYLFPIRSSDYVRQWRHCPVATDAGLTEDGGTWTDDDDICGETVSVDEASRTVTHTFTYRGQQHVVRYRATSIEKIWKSDWTSEESY